MIMQTKITGKGIDIGDSLREFTNLEISNLIDKYMGSEIDSVVTISKDNKLFQVETIIYLHKGFVIKTNGISDDPYKAVSMSLERLEEKIKKHKNRITDKKRRSHWEDSMLEATGYVLERKDHDDNPDNDEEHLIIAEQERYILSLSVSEAVMKLDLTDVNVVMFRNADSGRINVVYKRPDGHIGWIDYKE